MFAIRFFFLPFPFHHARGKIRTIPPIHLFPLVLRLIEKNSVEDILEISWICVFFFLFIFLFEGIATIYSRRVCRIRSIIWNEKIYREQFTVTGRFLNNSQPRHMSEAHPIFRPPCLETVVLRITTCPGR